MGDISVPPMKTTVSVECPTALYMAKPHALAGSAFTQGETKVPHRGQPAAPRPQRPREWSAEVRRTCAELAMNLRESCCTSRSREIATMRPRDRSEPAHRLSLPVPHA